MARKPSDIVQPNLRIREELRRRLERAATKNRVSLNVEMTRRLERSLDQEANISIAANASHLDTLTLRFSDAFDGLNKQGDLVRAAEALLKQIDAGNDDAAKEAAKKVRQAIEMIDHAAAVAVRKMHSTGADE